VDAEKKKALIAELSVAKNFDENLKDKSRIWFVDKVIRVFEGVPGATDAQVTQKTTDLVTLAKTRVTAERDFVMNLKADGNNHFNARELKKTQVLRVEILYGAIAHEPKLAESGQRDYLLFVARRRFRAVCRIDYWVNPNSQGYFRYAYTCRTDQRWRVNVDAARDFWVPKEDGVELPITMKPAGIADPVAAVRKLYVRKTEPCEGNLFDCAVAAHITFIDSLLEAKTPGRFLKALPAEYLEIDHVRFAKFSKWQDAAENPFKRVPVPMPPPVVGAGSSVDETARRLDLQVGDHCYIINHPLYKTFCPTFDWTGEFSFVMSSGNRDHRSQSGFVFGGHGKRGTLYKFYKDFVDELGTYLALVRQLARVHLAYMAAGQPDNAGVAKVEDQDVKIYDPIANDYKPAARHDLIAYNATVSVHDFRKVPTSAKPKRKSVQRGFLVVQSKDGNTFYFALVDNPSYGQPLEENLKKTDAEMPGPTRRLHYPIKIQRGTRALVTLTPAQIYSIKEWGVAFADTVSGEEKPWPFFEKVGGALIRKELTTDKGEPLPELFDAPFTLFSLRNSDIRVDVPRIDFGAHRTFLSNNGAF
jgi:hypothetical protein